ncbi:prepilin-type N-terminal cleavage/methylation domain-containing protein [Pseudothauera nasutitermitis]|uniref:Prepilin-type N-terminal cleavage/methylation domain-containing protein n=1 Tax=Pseudothauera nasutitermitis TaxID=2565930 RepID=A0A4V3WBK7_9RHOO|nr:prepilin-type N-terminal cleavage/methylation domain-containing protein [Pseudothauera nasutitermitis]THF63593.1 prepilin-type N-terminal cleavage/methylation domain-containing protein [Pseudothauera nasutitermitis]
MYAERLRSLGFTLIELIVVIVVLAAGLVGILVVFNQTVARSADPMLQQQAIAAAEGYMEEILSMRCPGSDGAARGAREFALDYDGTNEVPRNMAGAPIAALGAYNVAVQVTTLTVDPPVGEPGCRIRVTVTGPDGARSQLAGFRAND